MKCEKDKSPGAVMIGRLCRLAGCTPRTVRFYEEKGIIEPLRVTAGGRKLYAADAAAIIRLVRVLQEAGYSLDEAAALLVLRDSDMTENRALTLDLRRRLGALAGAVEKKRRMLEEAHRAITAVLAKTARCEQCGGEDCAGCERLADLRTLGLL